MKKLFVIFFILLFSFCSKKERSPYPRLIVPEQKDVINVNTKEMLKFKINLLASSFDKDTVLKGDFEMESTDKDYVIFEKADTIFPKYNFKIIIDTSYTIPAKNFEHKNIDLPKKGGISKYYEGTRELWKNYVTCFPLLILNNEKVPVFIKEMRMIQEAKDKDGIWKPIEFYDPLKDCFVNHHFFKFKSKKYEGVAIIKYHGDFKTKLRIKVKINDHYYYSNEFDGSINRSQFSHDYLKKYIDYDKDGYDENGYKAKYEKYTLLQYDF